MSKSLVIVESPAKAKTIGKYLGADFIVKASLGHIKDLPKKDLSVDVEKDFRPNYVVIEGKKKLIEELRSAAKKVDNVYLAADPDREGEAICQHLREEIEEGTKGRKDPPKIFRVMFNEITANAVKQAFQSPLEVNLNLVDAQQARRVLDRLVGYRISPLLWDKVRRGLSAGRVQTVAVRLIVEREREIRAFLKEEYWTIDAELNAKKPPLLKAGLQKINGAPMAVTKQEDSDRIVAALEGVDYKVASVQTREKRRNPVPPFITSTLQQEASRKLRFSVKRTMGLAQRLYEGVELGSEGAVGLITYMRTDSTRVSNDALTEVRDYVTQKYGATYVPEKPNVYKTKKDAQDAHEAIRPTSAFRTPESLSGLLEEDALKLYRLIWMRFLASQMTQAVFDQTTIDVEALGRDKATYLFRATGSVPKFDGFLAVYEEGKDARDDDDDELKNRLPAVTAGEVLKLKALKPEQHFTEPPPRFNEATLVKQLEAAGVGRPSTYASILSTIQDREYVKKEGGRFKPTELGTVVTDLLLEAFDDLFNLRYTARMEEQLDDIEEGRIDWRASMSEFYERLEKDIAHAETAMTNMKTLERPTDIQCEKCESMMIIRWGKHGSFLACSAYPECTSTREIAKEQPEGEEDAAGDSEEYCDNCGRVMVLKKGRFGQFYACSGYPECKTTRPIAAANQKKVADVPIDEDCPKCASKLVKKYGRYGEFIACSNYPKCKYIKQETTGVKCPTCNEGELVERRSKRGSTFFGCNAYPKCAFIANGKPIMEACPQCANPFLIEKFLKSGPRAACPNKECGFWKPLVVDNPAPAPVTT
jgi:DNA topoisomerase I